ncbi:MAG: hypothetical protein SF052_06340 [Bacteroidia bacterium]|nr:hypothetical protein [Bacteroidia bacterium]
MRYAAIFFMIFFLIVSCHDKSAKAMRRSKAASLMVGKKQQSDSIVWQLHQTYDPYNGGQYYPADSLNPQFLVLKPDGTFREYDTLNQSQGRWLINRSRDRIAKVYILQNRIEVPEDRQVPEFRYQILTHTPDSLQLSIQGRHGMLRLTYLIKK